MALEDEVTFHGRPLSELTRDELIAALILVLREVPEHQWVRIDKAKKAEP
jgi:hypothetical protein